MRKTMAVTIIMALVLSVLLLGGRAIPAAAEDHTILQFNTMIGIPQSFTGTLSPIRGINGGGLPWKLTSATGNLGADGSLELQVHGLVLAAGANAGKNPVPDFKVIVSCLSTGGMVVNVSSHLFAATIGSALSGGGSGHIETMLALPHPCIAPIVFVTSPTGAWFATTGR